MGLFGSSRATKLGQAIGIDELRPEAEAQGYTAPSGRDGIFGENGIGRSIAGTIGDFLLQRSGMDPIYAPQMLYKQRQALEEQQYQRHQESELAQRKAIIDYQVANRAPQDDQFSRALAAAGIQPGSPEYIRMNRERAAALTTRIVMTPNGPMMIGGGYGEPQDDGFDELPPGFTVKPGGAGSQAPRPFPGR